MTPMSKILENLQQRVSEAVACYWTTRDAQRKKQKAVGQKDQGSRSAVTGGAQMDGFMALLTEILVEAGVGKDNIFTSKALELPGFFRPTKKWDILVVRDDQLVMALEAKSQVGPSFGNNLNNRTEEAMGSALDLWTAFREGAFNRTVKPWLGYLFLLEDCANSRKPVKSREPHFEVFSEFKDASYARRYELFCRKLVRERHYSSAAMLLSKADAGRGGQYVEAADDLSMGGLVRSLVGQIVASGVGSSR